MTYLHDDVGMLEGEPIGSDDSAARARLTRVTDRYAYAETRECLQKYRPGNLAAAKAKAGVGSFRVASGSSARASRIYLREWRHYRH